MKKQQEKPLEKETRNKEDIDRGIEIRKGVMTTFQQEITHSELQKSFCLE